MDEAAVGQSNALTRHAFERTLTARNRSPRTIQTYARVWQDFAERSGGVDLTEVTRAAIEDYVGALSARVGESTAALHFRHLRGMCNWMTEEEIIDRSPMARMREPKGGGRPPCSTTTNSRPY